MSSTHPLERKLIGRNCELKQFNDLLLSCKIHHAWLVTGEQGIGKSTLCYHLIANILSFDSTIKRDVHIKKIISESHMDAKVLSEEQIKVQDIRNVISFLKFKPVESKYKVVLIDAIDNLNTNSANALLKTLEEPNPNTVLFLVCHNLAAILPTIRSRCNIIKIKKPTQEEFIQIAKSINNEFDTFELEDLYHLSGGSLSLFDFIENKDDLAFILKFIEHIKNEDKDEVFKYSKLLEKEDDISKKWKQFKFSTRFALHSMLLNNPLDSNNIRHYEQKLKMLSSIDDFHLNKPQAFKSLFV